MASSYRTIAEEMPDAYKNVDEVVEAVEEAGLANRVARLKTIPGSQRFRYLANECLNGFYQCGMARFNGIATLKSKALNPGFLCVR